jgi:acyl-CoA dehydrogenase family protein 9
MLEKDPLATVAIESSHCKLFGTTRAWDTLYDALQVAGGSGYLSTQPYERRMRDFRVTTIFEGTTEIHSIYPALFVMRHLTKRMQALYTGRLMQILFLVKGLRGANRWKIKFDGRQMNRAVCFAKSNARRIRLLIHAGMLLYGKNVIHKEFFLRRITHLSLYLYGTLAMLARIEAIRKTGGDLARDLEVLDYFVAEGRQSRKRNKRLFPNTLERLHRKIADGIRSETVSFRTDQTRAESSVKINAKKHRQKNRRQQRPQNSQRFYRVLRRLFQN